MLKHDAGAANVPLNELGWVGVDRSAREIVELREYLAENNGIRGLELFEPDQVEDIVRVFYRDGFVAVANVMNEEQLDIIRSGVDREIHNIMAVDGDRAGNRGSHRYSFGSASLTGHQLHNPEWAMLAELPAITRLLTAIFDSDNYILRGGGGDFCLPGAIHYQPLHADIRDRRDYKLTDGRIYTHGSFRDPRGLLTLRDLPCPYVCANFLMVDFTKINGPIRQIPGTQNTHAPIPTLDEEPDWMKLSTVCPAPAGSVVLRDPRAWHGGTPNLSDEVRAIPNCEFFAPWFREPLRTCMPRSLYDTLSDHGRKIAKFIVADKDQELRIGYREDLGGTPEGFDVSTIDVKD